MPICASSIPDRLPLLGSALLLLGSVAATAQGAPDKPKAGGGTRTAERVSNGDVSLDRLRASTAKRSGVEAAGPAAIPTPSPMMKKRAFDAIKRKVHAPAMEERAKAAQATSARRLAAEEEAMIARIHKALGLAPPLTEHGEPPVRPAVAANTFVPLLFASSSMPVETLRTYALQLEKVGGVIAFRGMPGGLTKVGPMAELTARMLRLDPGCEGPACAMRSVQVVVDPILFRQHGITHVPAFAMVPGDPTQPYCEREEETGPRATHIIYGDAALSGLIEEYARLGGKEEVRDAAARLSRR
jgi:type-F conjugative transfer system pilin assembly protein TrbC